jgi:hypothetical protein
MLIRIRRWNGLWELPSQCAVNKVSVQYKFHCKQMLINQLTNWSEFHGKANSPAEESFHLTPQYNFPFAKGPNTQICRPVFLMAFALRKP